MKFRPTFQRPGFFLEAAGCLLLFAGALLIWLRWVDGPIPPPAEPDLRWDRAQIDLKAGSRIGFEIQAGEDGLTAVEVGLVNHRSNGCIVRMKLYLMDRGIHLPPAGKDTPPIAESAMRILSWEPGKNYPFVFPPISDSKGKRFLVEFSLPGARKGSSLGLAGSAEGCLFLNGKPTSARVARRLYYDNCATVAWGIGVGIMGILFAGVGLWRWRRYSDHGKSLIFKSGWPALDRSFLMMEAQRSICSRAGVWKRFLIYGLLGILFWQALVLAYAYPNKVDPTYRIAATTGVLRWHRDFVYFLYYLGRYPAVTDYPRAMEYSRGGAQRLWQKHGETLLTDRWYACRFGEHGKVFLFLPHAWLRGAPVPEPMLIPFNAIFFTGGLLALFAAVWLLGWPVLGLILVVLLGSNPLQIFEVYGHNNVLGIFISTAIWVLSFMTLLLGKTRSIKWVWLAPLLAGALAGSMSLVRTEPVVVLIPALLLCLFAPNRRWISRLLLASILAGSFLGVSSWWQNRLAHEVSITKKMVAEAGGRPFTGNSFKSHPLWQSIAAGLGDFGADKGYGWQDEVTNQFVWEKLRRNYPNGKPPGFPPNREMGSELQEYTLGTFWDQNRHYIITNWELPGYYRVVREKVLDDILGDPAWYAKIIGLRIWRTLSETTPPRLIIGPVSLPILPSMGWYGLLLLPTALILFLRKAWIPLILLLFTLPLSTVSLAIFSGRGTTYYAVFHLFALGLCLSWLWELLLRKLGRIRPVDSETIVGG